jgi:DNA-binding NarL/FixJ family response regulator
LDEIRIAIVDDHDLFREGIKLVINQIEGLSTVFDTSDGNHFVEQLPQMNIDVVLMDIEMPKINGIQTTMNALRVRPDLKIIALTMFSDIGNYTQMIQAGVKGFILKKTNKFELQQAIQVVWNGGSYFSQELIKKMAYHYSIPSLNNTLFTGRELEILSLICQGHNSQEICDKLCISIKTVDSHRVNIFRKADVKNTVSLILWAVKNHYFTIE